MSKPLVSVTWLDAHGSATNELEEHELPSQPARYTTYGLLVKDCEAGIVVAAEETPARTYRGWTFIPRGMIVDIVELGKTKRRQRGKSESRKSAASGTDRVSGLGGSEN